MEKGTIYGKGSNTATTGASLYKPSGAAELGTFSTPESQQACGTRPQAALSAQEMTRSRWRAALKCHKGMGE